MTYHPQIHHRQSIRLKGYDYSAAGLYFITVCTQNRACLFGDIKNDEMLLNDAGKMIETEWMNLKNRFPGVELHEFVTMPNHFHGILEIVVVAQNKLTAHNEPVAENENGQPQPNGQPQGIAPTAKTVGDIIGAFKSITTVEYIRGVKQNNWKSFAGKLWQRNYWEHIIRNEASYHRISEYILNNPQNWEADGLKLHP